METPLCSCKGQRIRWELQSLNMLLKREIWGYAALPEGDQQVMTDEGNDTDTDTRDSSLF